MTKCMRAIIKCLGVEVGEVFKITDAKMSENRDTLSKMSVDDINNMFNLTKKRLGYD